MTARAATTWPRAMGAALLATTRRGRWWIAALATFLVRGGLLALLPAIVLVPTPAGLALHLDPGLTGDAPGDVTSVLVGIVVRLVVAAAIVLVATTALGARIEGDLVADAATDEELGLAGGHRSVPFGRAIVARLATHLPTLAALGFGGLGLTNAAYGELVSPSGAGSLAERVAMRAPLPLLAIGVAWLLGEAWGGLALRRLVAGDSLGRALGRGLVGVVRPTGLATLGLTSLAVALPAAALWLAASRAFDRLWPLVIDRADPWFVVIALGLLAGTWGAGLWLLAIGLAFRSAAWTAEGLREA
jgi:hypothetical protein